MERIPLRQYCRDIEDLINDNQSEEALICCQRVLGIYPHCLDVFRLMGKAHLELREYDKAESAFQKVLSSLPDDFVANLGMSLLREKQTNLSGAIWHMERANEAQLGNTALQNERRRLYKLRDGIATSRLPGTNGNLIRMYLNGDMLSNAITEINSVLTDDPSRMDVKVLLAQAYSRNGKKEETIQVCRELLKDLPYCFEANRILYETRSPAIKIEEMQNLQQRLRELDPYYEFITPDQPDIKKVPDDRVLIEVAEGLGPKTATTGIPDNLTFSSVNTNRDIAGSSGFGQGNQVPSWMQGPHSSSWSGENSDTGTTAGNSPATPNSGITFGKNMTTDEPTPRDRFSPKPEFSPDENQPANPFLSTSSGAIPAAEPGDIPEWLKALAAEPPAASSDAITAPLRVPGETGVLQTGEENLDFLRTFNAEDENEPPAPVKLPERPASASDQLESLPGILPPSPFLTSSETTQPVPIEDTSSAEKPTGRDMPDWLRSAVEPQAPEPESSNEVDFRQAFNPVDAEPAYPQPVASQPMTPVNPFEMPEELVTAPVSDEEVPTPEIEQYLEQLRKDITPEDQPEWLKKENLGTDLEALFTDQKPAAPQTPLPAPVTAPQPIPVTAPEPEPDQPDWMAALREQEVESPSQPTAKEPSSSLPENVPDWLFTPEEEPDGSTAPIQSETPVTHQPPPDWLAAARPDIFGSDDLLNQEPAASSEPEQISDVTASIQDEPIQAQAFPSELDFLKSESNDFMNADRSHLTDNLTMPTEQPVSAEEIDFTKAAPVENLPPDLAALLQEESEKQQIHTMPISEEPIESLPGFSLDFNIADLVKDIPTETAPLPDSVSSAPSGPDVPFSLSTFMEETLKSEPIPSTPLDLTGEESAESSESVAAFMKELLKGEPIPSTPLDLSGEKPAELPEQGQPSQPEVVPQAGIGNEPETTMPIEEIEVPQTIEHPVFAREAQPVTPEIPVSLENEPIRAAEPTQPQPIIPPVKPVEPIQAPVVMEPTVPVTRVVQEPTIPIPPAPVKPEPVIQEVKPEPVPVAFKAVPVSAPEPVAQTPAPESEPEPFLRTPLPDYNLEPIGQVQAFESEPVVEEPAPAPVPERKPVVPKTVMPKPVIATKPPAARPVTAPRPAYRPEKPVVVAPPTSARKNAGSADLTRAREAASHGDIATALRRYIKLINSNRALDQVSTDLKELVRKNPKNYLAWQTFGDARLRSNRIQEALDAYAKAADLLK